MSNDHDDTDCGIECCEHIKKFNINRGQSKRFGSLTITSDKSNRQRLTLLRDPAGNEVRWFLPPKANLASLPKFQLECNGVQIVSTGTKSICCQGDNNGGWALQLASFVCDIVTECDSTTSAPDKTTSAPDKTTSAPIKTTSAPDKTTSAPDKTTSAPTKTAGAPAKTTSAPDVTTIILKRRPEQDSEAQRMAEMFLGYVVATAKSKLDADKKGDSERLQATRVGALQRVRCTQPPGDITHVPALPEVILLKHVLCQCERNPDGTCHEWRPLNDRSVNPIAFYEYPNHWECPDLHQLAFIIGRKKPKGGLRLYTSKHKEGAVVLFKRQKQENTPDKNNIFVTLINYVHTVNLDIAGEQVQNQNHSEKPKQNHKQKPKKNRLWFN